MEISAGTIIILENKKILLCHPTNAPWNNSLGVPKGHQEEGESLIDCAIRETKEEVGIELTPSQLEKDFVHVIEYAKKNGQVYKKVYLYEVYINSLSEVGLTSEIVAKDQLQLAEVDWAGFVDKTTAKKHIFYRFKQLLILLDD